MDNPNDIETQLEQIFSDLMEPLPDDFDDGKLFPPTQGSSQDVKKRRQAKRQQVVFQALVENAVDAICISDAEGYQTYNNRACYEAFGYDYDEQEMDSMPLVSLWPEEDIPVLMGEIMPQARDGGWRGEARLRRRDGTLLDAHLTVFPVRDQADRLIGIATIIRDISDRKSLERERETTYDRRTSQIQLITDVAQEIAAAPNLDELYQRVVNVIKERFGYAHVQLFRYDPRGDAMVLAERTFLAESYQAPIAHEPYGGGFVKTAAATGHSILVPDVSRNPNWAPHPDLPDIQGELAVPVKLRNEVLGVLDVLSDQPGTLTREDEIALLELAGQIATAIENTRLLEETNVFRQFAAAPEGVVWVTLEEHVVIYANPTLCSILGEAKPEDTFGKPMLGYYPEDVRNRVEREILPAVVKEGEWVGELPLRSTRGKVTPTVQSLFLVRDEHGNPLYLANVVSDLTEQKRAEFLLEKRSKQMACLNAVSEKMEQRPPVDDFLEWVTQSLPTAMQYGGLCVASIRLHDKVYGIGEAAEWPCQISESLRIGGEDVGQICAAYTQERSFLNEEKVLLSDVARRVSAYVESRLLQEQTLNALERVRATHQSYRHDRWSGLTPEAASDDGGPVSQDGRSSLREPGERLRDRLLKTWRRISAGLL